MCSIHGRIGYDTNVNEEGDWRCHLQTYRVDNTFDDAMEAFNIQFLKPANVELEILSGHHVDSDHEAEIIESEEMEVNCVAANGLPQPTIFWYLNSKQIDFE